jgi:hypothetical protein
MTTKPEIVSAVRQHARFTTDTANTERENVLTMKGGIDVWPVILAPPPPVVGWPAAVGRRVTKRNRNNLFAHRYLV